MPRRRKGEMPMDVIRRTVPRRRPKPERDVWEGVRGPVKPKGKPGARMPAKPVPRGPGTEGITISGRPSRRPPFVPGRRPPGPNYPDIRKPWPGVRGPVRRKRR